MSNDNNQASARHHYVQRAYLDKFTQKGKIDVINRIDGSVRPSQDPKNVANMRGLYTAIDEKGNKDGSLESAFEAEIELPAIRIISNMTSLFPYIPNGEQKSIVAYYIAFQYLRTLEGRRKFEADAGRFAAIELFNIAKNPKRIKEHLKSQAKPHDFGAVKEYSEEILKSLDDLEIVPTGNSWFKILLKGMGHIAPILVERYRWHLFYLDKPSFITSDHPVILRKIVNDHGGTGFANADEVIFPLSKNHVLILSTDSEIDEGVHIDPDPRLPEMVNSHILHNSYLEVYSPPSLTPAHSGQPLGKRAITVMEGGGSVGIAFLQKYTGVLERERPHRN